MMDEWFEEVYDTPPPQNMLTQISQKIPQDWLRALQPVNKSIPNHSLYIVDPKGEWVDLHSVSIKVFYRILQSQRTKIYTPVQRWVRAYNGEELFNSASSWREWFLIP